DLRNLESSKRHEPEGTPRRGQRRTRGSGSPAAKDRLAGRMDPWTGHLPGFDALSNLSSVLPHRPGVPHAGESVPCQHRLELRLKVGSRNRRGIGPFPLEEMDVAVPESCRDDHAGASEHRNAPRHTDSRLPSNRCNPAVLNKDDAISDRSGGGIEVNRSAAK